MIALATMDPKEPIESRIAPRAITCACGSELFDKIPCARFIKDPFELGTAVLEQHIRWRCAKCSKAADFNVTLKGPR